MGEMNDKITLNFIYEEEDMLHLHKMISQRQNKIPKVIWIVYIYIIVFNVQNIFSSIRSFDKSNSSSFILICVQILAVIMVSLVLIYPILIKRGAIKAFKNNKMLQGEMEYTISEDEIFCKTTTSDSHYDWSCFSNVFETNHGFVLYLSTNNVILWPKRSFSDENEIKWVKDILMDKFKGKKYKEFK